ncbi:hypothetical protein SLS56_001683 [Neofusicoccum ribis]|uniref:Fungal N-terminal domain-containing protein n=1 Tax=Neofusicoccum ribis TaxID=45134 RepID=A0ABR3T7T8_9PEZI
MSFGWSVGDVVAASKLISEVINSLKEAGGASSAYQELIRELENLDRALKQVDQLQGIEADGIKCAALSCRFIITDFLRSIEKYGKTLAVGSTSAKVAGTARKAQWQTVQKSEVKKLREYVVAHVGTINMMLAHRAVQVATDASEKAGSNHTILSLKLNSIATSLGSSATTAAKTLALGRSMFQKLFDMVRTDVVEPLGALGGTVSNTL